MPKRIRNEEVCKSVAALIEQSSGSVAQFARELSRVSGERVPYKRVYDWRARNHIPRKMVLHIYRLTGIPTEGLLLERARNAAQSSQTRQMGTPINFGSIWLSRNRVRLHIIGRDLHGL